MVPLMRKSPTVTCVWQIYDMTPLKRQWRVKMHIKGIMVEETYTFKKCKCKNDKYDVYVARSI